LFYGSIYYQIPGGTNPTYYTERMALLFFSLLFMILGHQSIIPALLENRIIFYRERAANLYGELSYWISGLLFHIPLLIVNSILYSTILYNLVGFNSASGSFAYFLLNIILSSTVGLFIAETLSAISPNTQVATSLFPISVFFSCSFAGFIVYIPQFPNWLGSWAPYISFMRYSFQGLALNEFENNSKLPEGKNYISQLGFETLDKWQCLPIVFIFLAFNAFLVVFFYKVFSFESR
jgi:ABC-type multidrug transport system permease subunit